MNYYNYFTEIEEHFVRRRGKHLLVSPMDWHLIASWRDAGVPLNVALRGIDIAMDGYYARQTPRFMSRVNSLCYCHDAVMEAYAGYLESRVGEAAPEAGSENDAAVIPDSSPESSVDEFGKTAVLSFLAERISEVESLISNQHEKCATENLERAFARLREIALDVQNGSKPDTEALERDLGILGDMLCEELMSWISAEEKEEWEREAKNDKILKVYKKQLPKESYVKMRGNFFRDKIRKKFHIGELSLFRI